MATPEITTASENPTPVTTTRPSRLLSTTSITPVNPPVPDWSPVERARRRFPFRTSCSLRCLARARTTRSATTFRFRCKTVSAISTDVPGRQPWRCLSARSISRLRMLFKGI